MTEKRFCVVVYDDKSINGFAVLDLQKPNSRLRLGYENVYIGSKVGCEIVCRFGNSLADENEQLKSELRRIYDVATINKTREIVDSIYDELLYETSEESEHKRNIILKCLEKLDDFRDDVE